MLPASFSYFSWSVSLNETMYPPQRGLSPFSQLAGFRFELEIKNHVSR